MAVVDIGTGASITFSSSLFAQIRSIEWSGYSREAIDTTHMATVNAKTFMPSDLTDLGTLTVEVLFDPSENTKAAMTAAAENCTLTYPIPSGLTNAATRVCSAFAVNHSHSVPLEDVMTATYELKFTGNVTETDAS